MTLLLTAFEPFDAIDNASEVLLRSVVDDPPASLRDRWHQVRTAILPVDTEGLAAALDRELAAHRPATCVFMGQAGGRLRVSLERTARNLRRFPRADLKGRMVDGEPVVPGGPAELASTLPDLGPLVARLEAREIPAAVSDDAGLYLCNQLLYLGLDRGRRPGGPTRVGFLHWPLLPRQVIRDGRESPWLPLPMARDALAILLERWLDPA